MARQRQVEYDFEDLGTFKFTPTVGEGYAVYSVRKLNGLKFEMLGYIKVIIKKYMDEKMLKDCFLTALKNMRERNG